MTTETPIKDALTRLIASSIASLIAETVTLPTDVIKTRLQVQNITTTTTTTTTSTTRIYSGMIDAAISINKYEGINGLFRGLQPALIRQVSYTGLAFIVFEPVRDGITYIFNDNDEPLFITRVLSGGIAGAIGISVMNPTEVLKTKMQTNQSEISLTMTNVIKNVYKTDGIFGFWSGVWPNICRAFLVNAAEIGMYDNAKNWIINKYTFDYIIFGHIFASFIAGISSALISTPVDVVKTRFMNQAGHNNKQYNNSMFKTLINIPKEEGFVALYKGFTPIICRKVVWCTVFFVSYEQIRVYLGLPSKK